MASQSFKTAFDSYFSSQGPLFSLSGRVWNPPTDIFETPEAFLLKMEVAGARVQDLEISVDENCLTVRGHRCDQDLSRTCRLHQMEIRYGRFERMFGLSSAVEAGAIEARYECGFLLIRLPKRLEKPKSVNINIHVESD
ncbi:MAG: Spore protein SP21 [candidate division BRC1 bacterium ADurb.BinA364]|nr:MAG: Spore protein SP21 [candidate division BRC1 bacterium ADurb.BinA364]